MSDLFEDQDDFFSCQKEWQDMPEYVMEDLTPFKSIKVSFKNEEDFIKYISDTFGKIKNRNVTINNKTDNVTSDLTNVSNNIIVVSHDSNVSVIVDNNLTAQFFSAYADIFNVKIENTTITTETGNDLILFSGGPGSVQLQDDLRIQHKKSGGLAKNIKKNLRKKLVKQMQYTKKVQVIHNMEQCGLQMVLRVLKLKKMMLVIY